MASRLDLLKYREKPGVDDVLSTYEWLLYVFVQYLGLGQNATLHHRLHALDMLSIVLDQKLYLSSGTLTAL